MKKKVSITLYLILITLCLLSLGFNIYFLATKPKGDSGIFCTCKVSCLEVKAETEGVGESYGSAEILSKDGTIVTNAHVVTYTKLSQTYAFENISVRFVDEDECGNAVHMRFLDCHNLIKGRILWAYLIL